VVIGIDGLDPILVRKMVNKGELPNFERLIRNGVFGKLKSTIPPITFPAWVVMFTGKNPGKLGVFDFFELLEVGNSYSFRLVTTAKLKGNYLWDILGYEKKTCGVINIPFFTPTKIKGYMLGDFPESYASAYPKQLIDEIKSYIRRGQDFDPYSSHSRVIERIGNNTEIESAVGKKLRRNKNTDVFIQVFRILDTTSHHTLLEKDLKQAYAKMDKLIKQYVDQTNRTNLMIVSDHGIKRVTRKFYIDTWLQEHGYLSLKSTHARARMASARTFALLFYKLTGLFPTLEKFFEDLLRKILLQSITSITRKEIVPTRFNNIIDWERTVAVTNTVTACNYVGIWLDKKKWEKSEKLKSDLLKIRDPKTRKAIVKRIFNREDIYHGCKLKKLPDFIVEFDDNYLVVMQFKPVLFINTHSFSHRINGTLIACGPDFKKGLEIIGAEIIDIAPTILHIMGCPVSKDMDGKVLTQILKKNQRAHAKKTLEHID